MKKRCTCLLFVISLVMLLCCSSCKKETYEVSFDTKGGTLISSQNVEANSMALEPEDPTREDYIFLYWELNGVEYNFNTPVNDNIVLTAKWEKEEETSTKFTIKFDTNGGTSIESQIVNRGEKIMVPDNPVKDGFIFVKWQLNGVDYNFDSGVTEDIILVAVWEAIPDNTIVISYEIDGVVIKQNVIEAGKEDNAKPAIPEKEGYVGEWKEKGTSSGVIVYSVEYVAIEYKITFIIDEIVIGEDTYTIEDKKINEPSIPEKEGYIGKWKVYELSTEDVIVECEYILIEYVVVFVIEDEIVGGDTYTVEDKSINEPQLEPKEGYVFSGWFLNDQQFDLSLLTTGDILLEGYWKLNYSENLSYSLNADSKSYKVVSKGYWEGTDLIIPEKYNDLPVTIIGYGAFSNCESIESVSLSDNIILIEDEAFSNCCSLTDIEIPESVKQIGCGAFKNCSSLESITLPFVGASEYSTSYKAVFGYIFGYETIKDKSFYKYNLDESYIDEQYGTTPESTTWQYSCYIFERSSGNYYPSSFYYYIPSTLKNVTITNQNVVPYAAFKNCTNIENINYLKDIVVVNKHAFNNCIKLNYNVYDNAKYLGNNKTPYYLLVEAINKNITSCEIHNDVQYVIPDAFDGCNLLTYNVYDNAKYIGNNNNPYLVLVQAVDTNIDNCDVHNNTMVILDSAFSNCQQLLNINMSSNIKIIGEEVFYNCNKMEYLEIPNSVNFIGEKMACKASKLNTIVLPFLGTNRYYGLNNFIGYTFGASTYYDNSSCIPYNLNTITITGGKCIEEYAFYKCQSLQNLSIIGDIQTIKENAFSESSYLVNLTLGSNILNIESNFDYRLSNLSNIYYEGTIEQWCNISFETVTSNPMSVADNFYMINENNEWEELITLNIPETVSNIGDYQFYGFSKIEEINFHEDVINVGIKSFGYCKNITNLELPIGVLNIGERAFLSCYSLETVYISENVLEMGKGAFSGCDKLIELSLPFVGSSRNDLEEDNKCLGYLFGSSDKYDNGEYVPKTLKKVSVHGSCDISGCTFYGCSYIKEIVFGENIKKIENYSLYGCNSLQKLTIPFVGETIDGTENTSLGYIFGGENFVSTALSNLIITGGTTLYNYAFNGCGINYIEIPASVTEIQPYAFKNCDYLYSFNVSENNQNYCSIDGVLYSKNVDQIIKCPNMYLYTKFSIPNTVSVIANQAFANCVNVKDIEIPSSVKSIDDVAFSFNAQLNNIYYAGDVEDWLSISFDDIYGSNPLVYAENFYMYDENNEYQLVTEIEIPNTVTSIGAQQFCGFKNLQKVVISNSVTSIDSSAFYECQNLQTVVFEENSNLVSIEKHAFSKCSNLIDISLPSKLKSIGQYAFNCCSSIDKIIIPESVDVVGEQVFYGCDSLKNIYCEIDVQPDGWDSNWNVARKPVEWGYEE